MTNPIPLTLKLQNCKCIRNATISLLTESLNIKYGLNGTGKSTVAQALKLYAEQQNTGSKVDWETMRPYGTDPHDDTATPVVKASAFERVEVFDENYASNFVFKAPKDITNDSYGVLVKDRKCELLENEIRIELQELVEAFESQEYIRSFQEQLNSSPFVFTLTTQNKFKKNTDFGELAAGVGCFKNPSDILTPFRAYYSSGFVTTSKWAKWRNEGIDLLQGHVCPYCASDKNPEEFLRQDEAFKKEYSQKAMLLAQKILDYLNVGVQKGYINKETRDRLDKYIGSQQSAELTPCLTGIQSCTNYLQGKINSILAFGKQYISPNDIKNLSEKLETLKVEEDEIGDCYKAKNTLFAIHFINELIDSLKRKSTSLQQKLGAYNSKIEKLIADRQADINRFLALAGFPYEFSIKEIRHAETGARLVPMGQTDVFVDEPMKHLSWGEKNAFSLVMFMFLSLKNNADLIVLDDPISGFDKNKKFAIIRRLFEKREDGLSFYKKNVLMLTHDLQPIIDYVYLNMFLRYHIDMNVNARYLQNEYGVLTEQIISDNQIKNAINLTLELACDSTQNTAIRIVSIRKHREYTISCVQNDCVYQLLSNLIHHRSTPICYDANRTEVDMNEASRASAQEIVKTDYDYHDFDYNSALAKMTDAQLLIDYRAAVPFAQIIIARVWMERDDGQRLNRLKDVYPELCKFINESNHIENDYIFQLNPMELPEIPHGYLTKLERFIQAYPNINALKSRG